MEASSAELSPGFPKGLRVLVVDEEPSRSLVVAQLQQPELMYAVTSVSSRCEALAFSRSGVAAFDVVLAESQIVASDETSGRAFVRSFTETPVVLMSECGTTTDVLRAVQLGAVDFLDKPLSLLKLKNIWQHSVRKMMQRANICDPAPLPVPAEHAYLSAFGPSYSGLPHCSGPASPGTPSADSGDHGEAFSMNLDEVSTLEGELRVGIYSMHTIMDGGMRATSMDSMRASMDSMHSMHTIMDGSMRSSLDVRGSMDGDSAAPLACQRPPQPPRTFGTFLHASAPPTQWPALDAGCVWGTPLGGAVTPPTLPGMPPVAPTAIWAPLPPTAPAAHVPMICEPVALKQPPSGLLPVAASSDKLLLPDCFLSLGDDACQSSGGPLGLKLRKSPSLLSLINSTLGTA